MNDVVITISIKVPDGASVSHQSSGVPQSAAKPAAAVPPAAAGHCPDHGAEWEHKSGTSREGKPYDFWGCPVKDDAGYCKKRPPKGWEPPPTPPADNFDDLPF